MDQEVYTRAQATESWLGRLNHLDQIDFIDSLLWFYIFRLQIAPRILYKLVRRYWSEKEVQDANNAEENPMTNKQVRVPAIPGTAQQVAAVPNKFGTTKQLDPVWSAPTPPSHK
jgi:hypothetical protein